jgi:hypothetical protein
LLLSYLLKAECLRCTIVMKVILSAPFVSHSWGDWETGRHPPAPARGSSPLVESPFSYSVVLAASQHGVLLTD